ncbi:MAG TPA: CHAD domain-containing protein [Daejeonella sp.]|nr:CHAD domain-containing protein [Daejeonella sp.]
MKQKASKKHLNRIWKKTLYHLDRITILRNQEDIHQFRVNIKKIRAILTLFSQTPKNKDLLSYLKPVKKIFKQAGKIREADIHLQMAKEHHFKLPRFTREQQELMYTELHDFCMNKKRFKKVLKRSKKAIDKNLFSTPTKDMIKFYQSQLNQITLILAKRQFNKKMHDCRKQIKNLLYSYKVAEEPIAKKIRLNQPYLDQLQEKLGQWHDAVLSLQLFSGLRLNADILLNIKTEIEKKQQIILSKSENFWINAIGKNNLNK